MQVPTLAIVRQIGVVIRVLPSRRGGVRRGKTIIRACGGLEIGADSGHKKRGSSGYTDRYRDSSRHITPARNARSPVRMREKISLQQLHPQCAANSAIRAFDCDQIATSEPATSGAPLGVGYLIEGTALVRFAGAERQQFTGGEVPARSCSQPMMDEDTRGRTPPGIRQSKREQIQ